MTPIYASKYTHGQCLIITHTQQTSNIPVDKTKQIIVHASSDLPVKQITIIQDINTESSLTSF